MRGAAASVVSLFILAAMPPSLAADSCPTLTRSLSFGARGIDVRELQTFLMSAGVLSAGNATGYFGPLTQNAVGEWQQSHHIVSSRDLGLGWGTVGPKTRAAISASCSVTGSDAPAAGSPLALVQCPVVPQPAAVCTTSWQPTRTASGCVGSWYCVVVTSSTHASTSLTTTPASADQPPVITSFTGPLTIGVGEPGTWTVQASDPEGGTLTYDFTWGDVSTSAFGQILQLFPSSATSPQANHSYSVKSSYVISVVVRDPEGNTTETSTSVSVINANPNSPSSSSSSGSASGTGTSDQNFYGYGGQYQYWCPNSSGGLGYWSQSPCVSGVTEVGATGTNPYGSSSASSKEGGICAPDGTQDFVACPHMANCPGGGTYLLCKNGVWVRF